MASFKISNGGPDREPIIDAIHRLYLGIDANDLELFTSGFTEDAEVDLSNVNMGGQPMTTLKGLQEDLVPKIFNFLGPFGTSHATTTIRVDKQSADLAVVTYLIVAQHWKPSDTVHPVLPIYYTMSNRYASTVVRINGDVWKVKKTVAESLWALGDPTVMGGLDLLAE
ncbi:hypothetical protein FOPG_15021 [Fusarium oxysporum f. sp. conglutinans race 2 54008]|uniref:SnoaL-like domain-containing protein n=1 Tax=Fusarium oxysporum f. sp. conglutinans race 2 54008 TaxID=1089457 RepID=X0GZV3_FUSOX|nr:hypothetical protein FOPG_15021 [Fusarium oxysporum f. sp. conglutinans race 2 54008]